MQPAAEHPAVRKELKRKILDTRKQSWHLRWRCRRKTQCHSWSNLCAGMRRLRVHATQCARIDRWPLKMPGRGRLRLAFAVRLHVQPLGPKISYVCVPGCSPAALSVKCYSPPSLSSLRKQLTHVAGPRCKPTFKSRNLPPTVTRAQEPHSKNPPSFAALTATLFVVSVQRISSAHFLRVPRRR